MTIQVLFSLNYGSCVYRSAATSRLKSLDLIQSEGSLTTGVFCSKLIVSLKAETNIPLSLYDSDSPTKRYFCVFITSPTLHSLSLFHEGASDTITLWPCLHDTCKLLTAVRFDNPLILPFSYDLFPACNVPSPPMITHLSSMPRPSTVPQQLQS